MDNLISFILGVILMEVIYECIENHSEDCLHKTKIG